VVVGHGVLLKATNGPWHKKGWEPLVYILLPATTVYLSKISNNILQLQTTISFKMEHISCELHKNYSMQVMHHLCSKNTIPSKDNCIQPFPDKLLKNAN